MSYEQFLKDFGARVKRRRDALRKTQAVVADQIEGLDQSGISRIEKGEQGFAAETLFQLAAALDVPVFRLFGGPAILGVIEGGTEGSGGDDISGIALDLSSENRARWTGYGEALRQSQGLYDSKPVAQSDPPPSQERRHEHDPGPPSGEERRKNYGRRRNDRPRQNDQPLSLVPS